jgi:ABC-type antimicrobial peptide transport system permease subunit
VKIGDPKGPTWRRIVGIVGDVRHTDLDAPPAAAVYVPNSQMTNSYVLFVIRTPLAPDRVIPALRQAVAKVTPDVPVYDVSTAEQILARIGASRRFATALLSMFALVAVVLAAVGLYGVVAFVVVERTRELGVRVAFGAARGDIIRLIATGAAIPIVGGLGAGLLAGIWAARSLRALLFAVRPLDAPTYCGVFLLVLLVVVAAHALPVRRALSIDPVIALKQE